MQSEQLPNGDTNIYTHFRHFWPKWIRKRFTSKPKEFPFVYRTNLPRALSVKAFRDGKQIMSMNIVPETLSAKMRQMRLDSLEDDLREHFESEVQRLT